MDYRETLNLPKTLFPMKANLPDLEPKLLKWWDGIDVYGLSLKAREGAHRFILHDGPPNANAPIHMGTAMNKILKDIVVKHATMEGHYAPYVPGFDCHGMPTEHRALKELKLDRRKLTPLQLRSECHRWATHFVGVQTEQCRRLGIRGDWGRPYLTLQPEYEAKQIEVFAAMALKGLIYKGLKPVFWCCDCETALAEAEIEYAEKQSHSIYVGFPVRDSKGLLPDGTRVVIWTTTPWTLPANLAIALHPDHDYGVYETEKGNLLLATAVAEKVLGLLGLTGCLARTVQGRQLEWTACTHPWLDRESLLVLADFVSLEDGTGCVHIAPGHGHEDFGVGKAYGLEPLNPVNERGCFTEAAGEFAGQFIEKGNHAIIEKLRENGALLHHGQIQHSYAHCWRCRHPVIFRATEQWFANVDLLREGALEAMRSVKWVPDWGIDRIGNMVAGRAEWCISRQRWWGVPIPVFYCNSCNGTLMTDQSLAAVADRFRLEGSDAWWVREADELLPAGTACPHCGGGSFRKETDIMDVWFDSGSSHVAVCEERPELGWPADMYLEGTDQHRGWFQSSLLTSVVARGGAPYRTVITHGFIVDEHGRKMSKSLGNVIDPVDVCNKYGADILRLWVTSVDYRSDMSISDNLLRQIAETYRKVRNTLRFLLGNLYDFHPDQDAVALNRMGEFDRFMLHRLGDLIERCTQAYREYDYLVIYHAVHTFCTNDLSAFYLDIMKDCLYGSDSAGADRRSVQTVLYHCLDALIRLLSPILAFTTEEAYQLMPKPQGFPVSCQLLTMPEARPGWADAALAERHERMLEVRETVNKALGQARIEKQIGSSQEAAVTIFPTKELQPLLAGSLDLLPTLLIVSEVRLGKEAPEVAVEVTKPSGSKCTRCWNYRPLGGHPEHPDLCDRCTLVVTHR